MISISLLSVSGTFGPDTCFFVTITVGRTTQQSSVRACNAHAPLEWRETFAFSSTDMTANIRLSCYEKPASGPARLFGEAGFSLLECREGVWQERELVLTAPNGSTAGSVRIQIQQTSAPSANTAAPTTPRLAENVILYEESSAPRAPLASSSATRATPNKQGLRRTAISAVLNDPQIRQAFALFDIDCLGALHVEDAALCMKGLGLEVSQAELEKTVGHTEGRHGLIDYAEFAQIIEKKASEIEPDEEILRVFRLFDKSQTGRLRLEDLRAVATLIGEHPTDEHLAEMLAVADQDRDGAVNFFDFKKTLQR
eukprot:TRINITY_DN5112_c0_g1_i1.p1 TRINITY_DN5112_c0_g1~~TRINITY_DN5112_c0_g1_i1.p1  ORF type:complete len:321 (-),score=40.79 TRINITY_DN5112_c0_g1_i1:30-965(-)